MANQGVFAQKTCIFIDIAQLSERRARDPYPVEFALGKFSLEQGLSSALHGYVIPRTTATYVHQEDIDRHGLVPGREPMKIFESGNYQSMATRIANFIQTEDGKSPILYTMQSNVGKVESMLSMIFKWADQPKPKHLQICRLNELFYAWNTYLTDSTKAFSKKGGHIQADTALSSDRFIKCKEIGCEFHNHIKKLKYCSLAKVKQWSFIIATHCCENLAIKYLRGRHVPIDFEFDELTTSPSEPEHPRLEQLCPWMNPKRRAERLRSALAEDLPEVASLEIQSTRQLVSSWFNENMGLENEPGRARPASASPRLNMRDQGAETTVATRAAVFQPPGNIRSSAVIRTEPYQSDPREAQFPTGVNDRRERTRSDLLRAAVVDYFRPGPRDPMLLATLLTERSDDEEDVPGDASTSARGGAENDDSGCAASCNKE